MKLLFTTIIGLILLTGVVCAGTFYQRMPNDFLDSRGICNNENNTYAYDMVVGVCQPWVVENAYFWNNTLTGFSDATEEINFTTYGTLIKQVGIRTDDNWWIDYGIAPLDVFPLDCGFVSTWYPLVNYSNYIPTGSFTWYNETNVTYQNWSVIDHVCWRFRAEVIGLPDAFQFQIDGFHVDVEVIVAVLEPIETIYFISELLIILFVVLVFVAVKYS